ncbi:MAG: HD domain-containing phosphohydrolase [Deltaproteobacteria bacterium]
MYPKISVNLGNLILSLSDALDLAFPSLAMHQQRTAFIAWEIAKKAKLPDQRIEHVFLAGLLHDIGALSIEEKKSLHDNEISAVERHCIRGERLFKSNRWLEPCANLVRNHHRDWTTFDSPRDTPEAFNSQLLHLADYLERQIDRDVYILHQSLTLCTRIKELAGKKIDSKIVDLFLEVAQRDEFWLDLTSPRLYSLLLHNGPFQTIEVDINSIAIFAKLLGMIVDFKSPFTAAHSSGVAQCSMLLAEMVGMSESELKMMEVAGLLHDLGKIVVPNSILEKPAGLTQAEMAVMKQHAYHTFSILSTIGGLQMLAEWAAYHHEKLNGSGYPFMRETHDLTLGSRIMAVSDIFSALAEDRPYRKGMKTAEMKGILQQEVSCGTLDHNLVKLLLMNIEDVRRRITERQEEIRHYYKTEVERSE